jgi:hypothetical protein
MGLAFYPKTWYNGYSKPSVVCGRSFRFVSQACRVGRFAFFLLWGLWSLIAAPFCCLWILWGCCVAFVEVLY